MTDSIDPQKPMSPEEAMKLAISEARKGTGFVSPNPLVGCTILDKDHRLVASGYHHQVGQDHAEIDALKNALVRVGGDVEKLRGAHFYVTLEPCAHEGRTPSCAKALAKLPISSVTFGLVDPNPAVSGEGAKILRDAGIKAVEYHGLKDELEDLAEVFLHNMRAKEPFVALKVATSLDGQMGLVTGESKWITGEQAREHGHYLRASYDAIMIGRNTFERDNPSLNVRHPQFPGKRNKVVVLDTLGKTLSEMPRSNLLSAHTPDEIYVVTLNNVAVENPAGVQVLEVEANDHGGFVLDDLLRVLWEEKIYSIYVEGGAHTFGRFLQNRKAQRLHLFMAPCLIGGKMGLSWTEFLEVDSLAAKKTLRNVQSQWFGDDMYLTGRLDQETVES